MQHYKQEKDCLFCKIVAGLIPSAKIYEDDYTLAFLDVAPRAKGHALVIPKNHYRFVWDVEDIGTLYEAVKKVANAQRVVCSTQMILSLVHGEQVPHAHVQLIPTDAGATATDVIRNQLIYADGEKEETARLIREAIV